MYQNYLFSKTKDRAQLGYLLVHLYILWAEKNVIFVAYE